MIRNWGNVSIMCLRFVVRFIITALLPHCESKASYSRFVHDRFRRMFQCRRSHVFAIALMSFAIASSCCRYAFLCYWLLSIATNRIAPILSIVFVSCQIYYACAGFCSSPFSRNRNEKIFSLATCWHLRNAGYYWFVKLCVCSFFGSAINAVMSNMHYACMFNRVHVSVSVLLVYLSARLNVYESWWCLVSFFRTLSIRLSRVSPIACQSLTDCEAWEAVF